MYKQDFYFDLPEELIAQFPLPERSGARMLIYQRCSRTSFHQSFNQLPDWIQPGDLLVFNNSKVIPARLFAHKSTGGKVELLIERILNDRTFLTHIRGGKSLKPETVIHLENTRKITVLKKENDLFHCKADVDPEILMEESGHIPLPPYISREDQTADKERYQTVYAQHRGSIAAPTAGLHFDEAMLQKLKDKGIESGYATLHVGAGTFRPVRADMLQDHRMHSEHVTVNETLCEQIRRTKQAGKRVIAVGTTAMRCLETAARSGEIKPFEGDTDIFIYPGYRFKICDALLTNFHLPESTLLMLVSAFIGHPEAMALYKEAIALKYRFFSYGDTTLLL